MAGGRKHINVQDTKKTNKEVRLQGGNQSSKEISEQKPLAIDTMVVCWSESSLDKEFDVGGDWNLSSKEVKSLLELLASLQGMTWREVKELKFNSRRKTRQLHHSQPVTSICSRAQKRIRELNLDIEEVFRFRHGNTMRLWGYMEGARFCILWFDRQHAICPSDE